MEMIPSDSETWVWDGKQKIAGNLYVFVWGRERVGKDIYISIYISIYLLSIYLQSGVCKSKGSGSNPQM